MALFQPAPTWAPVIIENERTGEKEFNPVWLKWFLDVVGLINTSGGGAGTIQHNGLAGLQGGVANEYFHLTSAQYTALGITKSNFMVYQSAAQAITAATPTTVLFATKVFDVTTEVSATGVFTAGTAGYYMFSAGFTGTQAVATTRYLALYVNGVERARLQGVNGVTGVPCIAGAVVPIQLAAGNTVTVVYYSALADTGVVGQVNTYFGGYRLQ